MDRIHHMLSPVKLRLATVLLGLIFLFSGITKGIDIHGFGEILMQYRFDWLYFFAPLISAVEIFIGFALILLVNPRKTSFASLLLVLFFTLVFAVANIFLGAEDCGCFGSLFNIPSYISYTRNLLMTATAWIVWRHSPREDTLKWEIVRIVVALTFAFISLVVATIDLRSAYTRSHRFVGHNITKIPLPRPKAPRADRYLIFIFKPSCPHCQKAVPMVKEFLRDGVVDDIFGIYPSFASDEISEFIVNYEVNFPVRPCNVDSLSRVTKSYPFAMQVVNDTVVANFSGTIPSPRKLRRK